MSKDPERVIEQHGNDAALLARYAAAFERLGDLSCYPFHPLLVSGADEYSRQQWKPLQVTTPIAALEALYRGLGLPGRGATRLPPLYERFLLTYRWAEVDLGSYRLLANDPAGDLSPLLNAIQSDAGLYETLAPMGYVQFGRGPDMDYDPVCFDLRQRQKNGDCRIVKLEHEAILCDWRIQEVAVIAPNFRTLVMNTIRCAETKAVPGA